MSAETSAPRPVIEILRERLSGVSIAEGPAPDMPTLHVERERLIEVCRMLRDAPELQFAVLIDVIGVDRLPREPRFEVVYLLVCLGEAFAAPGGAAPARRLRLKTFAPGDDPRVPSVTSVWPAANWAEREIFDLFGVHFDEHPDLRRILTPEDWEGYPLRKDYPVQVRKDAQSWEPVQLSPEEFAANIRAQRERADRAAERPGSQDRE
jgi:NADH-quinone oxidoreductase subunit C